ncbi:MAG: hypothetical protein CL683_03240 [Brevundimonas sp.]|jgi:uncharacterized phage-associated protein|uniref:Panacea domain-containing protein n=2 Tax=unclassified Brevundimonas TaxID=2622653 RepID=UPI000C6BD55F|nr:hypothetical protein [Brevundimonas sp.]HAJ02337.1 hypothetical protein [Brevundimonas sp.]|tara:strand:- start:565 stop:1107 length:543 start_codon:yes stop_codon:yes gene_type:complete
MTIGRRSFMAAWSPAIANEFIRLATDDGKGLTQMQLQKLVYIANGWSLAIRGEPLTADSPQAWTYGPVYPELHRALRSYGRDEVSREIRNSEFIPGMFEDEQNVPARAALSGDERAIVTRVYRDYGKFHAFQLSALTHRDGTPWTQVYNGGLGKFDDIPSNMIRDHFVELARTGRASANA